MKFPRDHDNKPAAWRLSGKRPEKVWERFSPSYETQLERMVKLLEKKRFSVEIRGAGSEDGEYISAIRQSPYRSIFRMLEDPREALFISEMDDNELEDWLEKGDH
ncbi:hypothetical protein [Paracoccus sp. MKU1]|uniref:hypothetical protein n=1 Tax=Paracoccus sp. MKU1 TaxID=1745182 RepID=UPI00128EE7C2|nr:hypothetical protein [Paracoccus sp. MKU1]